MNRQLEEKVLKASKVIYQSLVVVVPSIYYDKGQVLSAYHKYNANFVYTSFKLNINKPIKLHRFIYIILQLVIIQLKFYKKLIVLIRFKSYFEFFFDVFLYRIKTLKFQDRLDKAKELRLCDAEIAFLEERVNRDYTAYRIYALYIFYLWFLTEWKANFSRIVRSYFKYNIFFKKSYIKAFEAFDELKELWFYKHFINLVEFRSFLFTFVDDSIPCLKNFLYIVLLEDRNINYKFQIYSLYSYLLKVQCQDISEDLLSRVGGRFRLSGTFLSKWFYCRQINKFYNTELVYDYNILKPFNFLNFSFLEATLYNLNVYSGKQLKMNLKLDSYLQRSVWKGIPAVKSSFIPNFSLSNFGDRGNQISKRDFSRNNNLLNFKKLRLWKQKRKRYFRLWPKHRKSIPKFVMSRKRLLNKVRRHVYFSKRAKRKELVWFKKFSNNPHNILLTSGGRGWLKKMPSGNVKRLWDPKSFSHPPGWFWYKRRVSKGPKMHKKDTEVLFRNLSLFYIKRILI